MLFRLRGVGGVQGLYLFDSWSECLDFINEINKNSLKIFHAKVVRA